MNERQQAMISLLRLHVYLPMCFLFTAIGIESSGNLSIYRLLLVGFTTSFALATAFIFNDVEDATDDSIDVFTRNPVALGLISRQAGYSVAVAACLICLSLSLLLSSISRFTVILILIITFIYSWRPIRLKSRPFWDIAAHILTSALVFLAAAWSSETNIIFYPKIAFLSLIISLGVVVALLTHQLYEYENDLNSGVRTSVVVFGKRKTFITLSVITLFLVCLIITGAIQGYIPILAITLFVITSSGVLAASLLFSEPASIRSNSKRVFPWAVSAGAFVAIVSHYLSAF